MSLTNGHILVTGACGGMGRSIVAELTAQGYSVTAADIAPPTRIAPDVDSVRCDVSDAGQVAACVDAGVEARGPLTGVVHAAGILHPGTVQDVSPEQFRELLTVNTYGAYLVLRETAPRLKAEGGGSIVVVTSNSAHVPRQKLGLYGASKAATEMLAKSVGLTYAGAGVRVNCVAPGSTRTPMLQATMADTDDVDGVATRGAPQDFRLGIPLGRINEPADVTAAVMFLLGEGARGMTMETLTVDGGAGLGA